MGNLMTVFPSEGDRKRQILHSSGVYIVRLPHPLTQECEAADLKMKYVHESPGDQVERQILISRSGLEPETLPS